MKPNIPKLIFAILASLYVLWIAYDPMQGSFLDNVDLPIHETGHLLFRPFGEFMMVAGGSLFQVIFPIVFVGYFIWQRSYYSASNVMLWVGQSILNVWVYGRYAACADQRLYRQRGQLSRLELYAFAFRFARLDQGHC